MEAADLEAPRAPPSQGGGPHRGAALPRVQLILTLFLTTVIRRPEAEQVKQSNLPGVKKADCLGLDDAIIVALVDGDTPEAGIVEVPALQVPRDLLVLWSPEHEGRHEHEHQTSHCRPGAHWLPTGGHQPAQPVSFR